MTRLVVNGRFLTRPTTGVQRYAWEVTSRLPVTKAVDRVDVVHPDRETFAALPGMQVRTVGRLAGHAWEQLELPRAVGGADRAVLWSPATVGPLAVRDQVVTIHDLFAIRNPEWVGAAFHRWYSWLLPRLVQRCRHVITISAHAKEQILDSFDVPPEKVTVVPEGVSPTFAPSDADAHHAVRERYGLPERFVLVLGSLEPRKNLPRLLEAWSHLPERERPTLAIAGGIGAPRVFGRFDAQPFLGDEAIRYLGYVPDEDLPALYSAASVFAYPSLEEGFGLPPLEAIACGTAVLTSATSAMLENCRGVATLVDPTDVDAISHGLDELLMRPPTDDERARRRDKVVARFDWRRTADQVARIVVEAGTRA